MAEIASTAVQIRRPRRIGINIVFTLIVSTIVVINMAIIASVSCCDSVTTTTALRTTNIAAFGSAGRLDRLSSGRSRIVTDSRTSPAKLPVWSKKQHDQDRLALNSGAMNSARLPSEDLSPATSSVTKRTRRSFLSKRWPTSILRSSSSLNASTSTADSSEKQQGSSTTPTTAGGVWIERLTKISNVASLLCVIDCTVLPIITVALPLLGLASTSPAQTQWLHELGHKVALWFVMPVGGLASVMNFINHRKPQLTSISIMGLMFIYAANAGHHAPLMNLVPHKWAHALHCGTWLHRSTNIIGCALLLSSNYFSHRATCTDAGHNHGGTKSCSHDHDHSHDH